MKLAVAPPKMQTFESAAASRGEKRARNTSSGRRMPPPPIPALAARKDVNAVRMRSPAIQDELHAVKIRSLQYRKRRGTR
jgi:hypothetical protein